MSLLGKRHTRAAERLWAGAALERVIMALKASGESGSLWTRPDLHVSYLCGGCGI